MAAFAEHRLVDDSIPAIDLRGLLPDDHRHGWGHAVAAEIRDGGSPEIVPHANDAGSPATSKISAICTGQTSSSRAIVWSLPLMASRRCSGHERIGHPAVAIVALTAHALPAEREAFLAQGCDAVISKPCLPEDLIRVIERLLSAQRAP
jgi:DNA-binding NarL/FixJ family response regulator